MQEIFFADDIASSLADQCLETLFSHLEYFLIRINDWCLANDILVNGKKTKFMIVNKPNKFSSKKRSFALPNSVSTPFGPIERVSTFRYLGLLIDESLTFHDHVKMINDKMRFKSQQLIHNKCAISNEMFPTAFKAAAMPYLDFALPFFSHCPSLHVIQDTIDFFLKCYYVKEYAYKRFHYVKVSKIVKSAHDPSLGKVKLRTKLKPVGTKDLLSFYERLAYKPFRRE